MQKTGNNLALVKYLNTCDQTKKKKKKTFVVVKAKERKTVTKTG